MLSWRISRERITWIWKSWFFVFLNVQIEKIKMGMHQKNDRGFFLAPSRKCCVDKIAKPHKNSLSSLILIYNLKSQIKLWTHSKKKKQNQNFWKLFMVALKEENWLCSSLFSYEIDLITEICGWITFFRDFQNASNRESINWRLEIIIYFIFLLLWKSYFGFGFLVRFSLALGVRKFKEKYWDWLWQFLVKGNE